MDPSLPNVDLNENRYAGSEHDTNKSLRDFALERRGSRLAEKIAHSSPGSPGTCAGRLDLTAFIPSCARQCRLSSNLMSSLLVAGLRQAPSLRREKICFCMRRLPRRSWKPQMRPAKSGTRRPLRRELLTRQGSSSMTTRTDADARALQGSHRTLAQCRIELF
jgi:hypothetical protein